MTGLTCLTGGGEAPAAAQRRTASRAACMQACTRTRQHEPPQRTGREEGVYSCRPARRTCPVGRELPALPGMCACVCMHVCPC